MGLLLHRTKGGPIARIVRAAGFVALMILSWIYAAYVSVRAVETLFFGLKAAVLAIVLQAVRRIGSRALASNGARLFAVAAFVQYSSWQCRSR